MSETSKTPSVLIVAAEASSSLYAQRLLEAWQRNQGNIHAWGIGSQAMVDRGFEAVGRAEDLAVVGLVEVVKHYPDIRKVFWSLVEKAKEEQPRFALLLDYPDFNLRLAKQLKKLGIPVIYYISPQLWAWRKGRIRTVQKYVDRMLVVFPFETDFYKSYDVDVDFVGHPLLDELDPGLFDTLGVAERRQRYGFKKDEWVLGLMPGSRLSEIHRHLQVQVEAARELLEKGCDIKIALFVAPTLDKQIFRESLDGLDIPLTIVQADPFEMIALADMILCASGTATVMVGLMEKPMVVMYKMKALSAMMMKRLVKRGASFAMVNLILNKKVVPELFQNKANPQALADELELFMADHSYRLEVVEQLKSLKTCLGDKGATDRVIQILQAYL